MLPNWNSPPAFTALLVGVDTAAILVGAATDVVGTAGVDTVGGLLPNWNSPPAFTALLVDVDTVATIEGPAPA